MRLGLVAAVLLSIGAGCLKTGIATFEECAAAGYPVMESYPRQCRADGKTFVENVSAPAEPEPEAIGNPETLTLKIGESKTYGNGLVVGLKAIDDSRCPKDVLCIWAGELSAVLSVALDVPGSAPMEVRLGQTTKPKAEAYGFSFELVSIDEETATLAIVKN